MTAGDMGPLDLASPVSHVAASLDRAAPAALSLEALATGYVHPNPSDLSRIRNYEGLPSDAAAIRWLIGRAVDELRFAGKTGRSRQQLAGDNGSVALAVDSIEELRWRGKKVYAVAASNDKDEENDLRRVYNDLSADRSFWVTVTGAKGGRREVLYLLHPLARAIPRTGEKEFLELAADVKARGVRMPVITYHGLILDGRHRVAVASALKVPVRVEEFKGTEDEARDHVLSLNVQRRHLTVAQRALIVLELFLPQAEAEAKERQRLSEGRGAEKVAPDGATISESAKAVEIAAARSNGLANVRTLERMKPVLDAPRTRERVRSGKVASAAAARKEAIAETGRADLPAEPPAVQPRSAFNALGDCLGGARRFAEVMESGERGGVADEKILARLAEITGYLERGRTALETNE